MSPKINLAIIGLDHWYWALGCAYSIAINPAAKLLTISDSDEERAKRIARVYGAEKWSTNYHELLKDPKINGVVITTTTNLHAKIAIDVAEAGKNILLGKPMARTLKEADQIIEAARKAGVKLMPMGAGVSRGDPIKKLIDEGVIGEPFLIYSSLLALPPLRAPGINEPGWFVDPQKAAGGGFIDHGIYGAGEARDYFNDKVSEVHARMGKFIHKEYKVEDYGVATVKFKNGSIAIIESSFTAPIQSHGYTRVIGTDGEIELKDSSTLSIWSKKETYKNRTSVSLLPPPPVYSRSYAEIPVPTPPFVGSSTVDEFIECIVEDREPIHTGEDGRTALEICLAAYESVRTGGPIRLPLKTEVDVPSILANL